MIDGGKVIRKSNVYGLHLDFFFWSKIALGFVVVKFVIYNEVQFKPITLLEGQL